MEKDLILLVLLIEEFRDAVEYSDGEKMAIYNRIVEKKLAEIKERYNITFEKTHDAETEIWNEYYHGE